LSSSVTPDPRFLAGRHAIVTGGGRGIGAAIADTLAAAGANVTVMGRDVGVLTAQANRLREDHGVQGAACACDVTDEESVRMAFDHATAELGDAYVLVNNAGQAEGQPFLETSLELWQRLFAVNATGAFLCTRAVLGPMLEAGAGRVINIASTTGLKGYRNVAAYTASKHGVVGLTRALAAETARRGITVNAVCPGYTDTEMTQRAVSNIVRDLGRSEEEARALIVRSSRRGTLIEPREVASAVLWLCSPDATAVSGQAIVVAGGEV
jgi:NAD(P)-dependent dehydrogenase (short-subunit alcohol dehydrogenase family)